MDKEIEDQYNDTKIKKVWKNPSEAREMAQILFIIGVIFGAVLVFGMVVLALEFYNNGMDFGDYKQLILDYSDCHSMKLMLSNENLGAFHERLTTQWLVNCGK